LTLQAPSSPSSSSSGASLGFLNPVSLTTSKGLITVVGGTSLVNVVDNPSYVLNVSYVDAYNNPLNAQNVSAGFYDANNSLVKNASLTQLSDGSYVLKSDLTGLLSGNYVLKINMDDASKVENVKVSAYASSIGFFYDANGALDKGKVFGAIIILACMIALTTILIIIIKN
jgi:hypothetical protein